MTGTNLALQKNAQVVAALAAMSTFSPTGQSYMKVNANTGSYTYGKDETVIPEGTEIAVDLRSVAFGWICWKDDQVAEEIMALPFAGEIPIRNEEDLPDHGPFEDEEDGWSKQASVTMKLLDTGEELLFKTSSGSGVSALNTLLRNFTKEMTQHPDDAVVIITLNTNSFMPKEKKYGKKYAPVFKITRWTTETELQAFFSSADDATSYEAPAKVETKAVAAPAKVAKVETPAKVAKVETPAKVEAPKEEAPVAAEVVAEAAPAGGRRRRF